MPKKIFLYLFLSVSISLVSSNSHFKFDHLESTHECQKTALFLQAKKELLSFTIYGSFAEEDEESQELLKKKYSYNIETLGTFTCSLQQNEQNSNSAQTHKITCILQGSFPIKEAYILKEPSFSGLDFTSPFTGESTWPSDYRKKTFFVFGCNRKKTLIQPFQKNTEVILPSKKKFLSFMDIDMVHDIQKDLIEQILTNLPKRSLTSLEDMSTALANAKTTNYLTQAEGAYLVYRWLSENIAYDCYGYVHNSIDYSTKGTYNKGKGVCQGYADLFDLFMDGMGIEAEVVVGYSKGAGHSPGEVPTRTNHAWNAVRLFSEWYLIDATWGSGSCNGEVFTKSFNEYYFCTPPEQFVRSHLPAEAEWQLLGNLIDIDTFANMAELTANFFSNGFNEISPDAALVRQDKEFNVLLRHKATTDGLAVIARLYLLDSSQRLYIEQKNTIMIVKNKGSIEINAYLNEKGQYKLSIYGGDSGLNSYPNMVDYIIQSSAASNDKKYYPQFYGLYSQSDFKILEPLNSPLVRGTKVNFKVYTTTYDNVYISVGSSGFFTELYKKSDGIFEDSDIFIFGEQVGITTLNAQGSYSYIALYETAKNDALDKEPTFPKAYSSPKNKLIEPICDTLIKGKTYSIKIQCDSVGDVAVIDGSKWTFLTKNGSTFSGQITVQGTTVKITYKGDGGSYYTFYQYNVSS